MQRVANMFSISFLSIKDKFGYVKEMTQNYRWSHKTGVSIDNSQFGFVPERGSTDAIFVVRQLQEKYLAVNKRLYMALVDLEKAFDRVPLVVIWWVLR